MMVGLLVDLSGPTSDVCLPYAKGVKDCAFYFSKQGFKIKLLMKDTKYSPQKAVEYYNQVKDKVVAIIGWGTGSTLKLAPLAAKDKIPVFSASFAHSLGDPSKYPYNFYVGVSYAQQVRIALKFISTVWKQKRPARVALIYNPTPFGEEIVAPAYAYAKKLKNLKIVGDVIVELSGKNAVQALSKLEALKADWAIIQETTTATVAILKAAKKLNIKTKFIGLNWASSEHVISLAEEAAQGYYGIPCFAFPHENVEGMKLIKKQIGAVPVSLTYAIGWVTAYVLFSAMKSGSDIKSKLESMKNFSTLELSSPISFSSTSHRGQNKARVYKVQGKRFFPVTGYILP